MVYPQVGGAFVGGIVGVNLDDVMSHFAEGNMHTKSRFFLLIYLSTTKTIRVTSVLCFTRPQSENNCQQGIKAHVRKLRDRC